MFKITLDSDWLETRDMKSAEWNNVITHQVFFTLYSKITQNRIIMIIIVLGLKTDVSPALLNHWYHTIVSEVVLLKRVCDSLINFLHIIEWMEPQIIDNKLSVGLLKIKDKVFLYYLNYSLKLGLVNSLIIHILKHVETLKGYWPSTDKILLG